MAAGFATQTERVAAFTVPATPEGLKYRNGFASGVRYACPKCRIDLVDLPDTQNVIVASEEATKYVALGADVVFAKAEEAGGVALLSAADGGAWAIGFGRYPNDEPPPEAARLMASVYIETQSVLEDALRDYGRGQPRSGVEPLSLANGGLGLVIYRHADAVLSTLDLQDIEKAKARLAEGSLETGVDPQTGEER
jgi:basic membrane lipoprotein Med (substrate-binding protein (PBP1-ABC) superfamily)